MLFLAFNRSKKKKKNLPKYHCDGQLYTSTWLNWLRDTREADKTLFLGASLRLFLEEISIWIGNLSKEGPLTNAGGHHWGPGQDRKLEE